MPPLEIGEATKPSFEDGTGPFQKGRHCRWREWCVSAPIFGTTCHYADLINLLICCAVAVFLGLIVGSVAMKLTMLDFVVIAATVAPALLWVVREQFRQSDAADAGDTLKSDAERLFDDVKSGACSEAECEGRSREFQDAIFGRRVANPLIFPLIYRFMRPEMEKQMEAGAAALLKEFVGPKA